ncbi:MAG: EexN family lipoprotein [Acidimicrobiales bacterium]
MKKIALLLLLAVLASCGKSAPPDSIDSLVAHPHRLQEVLHQCRDDRAEMGDAICDSASEAFRRRFMGSGKAQYTPNP